METPFTVADYMSRKLITLNPDMDILHAGSVLLKHDISGAPVLAMNGELVGIVTEKDFFKTTVHAGYFNQLGGKVSDYMSHDVISVAADMNILDMAEMFLKTKYRRYPVTAEGKLIGLISRRDVLRALHSLCWPTE